MDLFIRKNLSNKKELHFLDGYQYVPQDKINDLKAGLHIRYINKLTKKIKIGGILLMVDDKLLKLKTIDNQVFWDVDTNFNYIYSKKMIKISQTRKNFNNLLKSIDNGTISIK